MIFLSLFQEGKKRTCPLTELTVTNNKIHMHTCADSCVALASLIKYLAEDGDLTMGIDVEDTATCFATSTSNSVFIDRNFRKHSKFFLHFGREAYDLICMPMKIIILH